MPIPTSTISVATSGPVVFVKLIGRANFSSSVQFKRLVTEMHDKGFHRFLIDLTDCLIMDSTFLGVLAALGLRLSEKRDGEPDASLTLFNPNSRISELLENLGVTHLFNITQGNDFLHPECHTQAPQPDDNSKVELSKTCLEAHKTLMAVNSANVPKFKDVTQFFAEDVKRLSTPAKAQEERG